MIDLSDRTSARLSVWSALRENAPLIVMYVLGAALSGLMWWPLAPIYLVYSVLSNLFFMAHICPYCSHYGAATCPAGYHVLSGGHFRAREGRTFGGQFKRNVTVLFPGWFLPPVLGLYLLIASPSWWALALLLSFCLAGFVVLPLDSRRHCSACENTDCPRRK